MKSFFFTALVALTNLQLLVAQRITGIVESAGKPVDYATVLLKLSKDSSLVKGTVSDSEGRFDFQNILPGMYFIEASSIGLGSACCREFEYKGGDYELEDYIHLVEDSKKIAEVTIVARKPPVEVRADKTILNVEGTVNSTGLNALELLRKAPGVTVDNNEKINVKGKNGVRILIDGRNVPLDGKDLSALLKSTQANDIANIEIISNPSAKYDAAGNAGIINIRLRKNKAHGTNGNVGGELTYGQSLKAGSNLSLNHRTQKVNVFGSYNNHYGDWHEDNNFVREQGPTPDSIFVFDQTANNFWRSKWNGGRVGADFFLSEKHTFGVLLNGGFSNGGNFSDSRTKISMKNSRERIDSLLLAKNEQDVSRPNLNANLNYRFADTSGRSLNVDLDRGVFRNRDESFLPNFYRSPSGEEIYSSVINRNVTPVDIEITTGKIDYEQRLFKGTFGLGAKVSNVETDNTFNVFNVKTDGEDLDEDRSNRFVYKERTAAGYVNYNRNFGKKLNLQAGLRVENTDYMGDLTAFTEQNGERVEDNYTEFFPSAAVTYSFNEKLGLNSTFSRRIDRPSYQDLNPFNHPLDELTFRKGNPRLRPQFTNSFEIAPTFQGFPIVSIGYSHTKDVFTQVLGTEISKPKAAFITNENLADQKNWTLTLNAPTPIAKWWDGFVSLTGFRSHFRANIDSLSYAGSIDIDQSFASFNAYVEQNFKLPKGFKLQISGWYNSPGYWGTMRALAQGSLDAGLSKKILKEKGEIRLRVGDIFHTSGWRGSNVFTPGLVFNGNGYNENQTVVLNFSYRFGNSEVKAARQRKTGLEDERRRVKN